MAVLPDFGYGEPRTQEISEQVLNLTNTLKGYSDAPASPSGDWTPSGEWTFGGSVQFADGSGAEPSVKLGTDGGGLFRAGANALGFSVNSDEHMRLTDGGLRIESGTVSGNPAAELDVRGTGILINLQGSSITGTNSVNEPSGDDVPTHVLKYLRINVDGTEYHVALYTPA